MNREPLARGEKGLAVASVAVVGALLLGGWWVRNNALEPEIDYPPQPAVPSPNGYDVYVRAAQNIQDWTPPVDFLLDDNGATDSAAMNPKTRAQRYSLRRREAWLKANAAGFKLFERALALPCRNPGERDKWGRHNPDLDLLRSMARWKVAEVNTYKLRGDWGRAMKTGLDTLQMAIDTPRGGAIRSSRTASTCITYVLAALEDLPERLDAVQARITVRRLEALIARRVSYADAIEEDKWARIKTFVDSTRQHSDATSTDQKDTMDFPVYLSRTEVVKIIERSSAEAIEEVGRPYDPAVPHRSRNERPRNPLWPVYNAWAGDYGGERFTEAREKTRLYLLLVRLALRAYTLDTGAPPRTLQELAPAYLKSVPTDVFGAGAPFRYRVEGKIYRLWSIGPDMKDDNGTPVPWAYPPSPDAPPRLPPVRDDSKGDWVAGKNQ